jgi:hypothetical protein
MAENDEQVDYEDGGDEMSHVQNDKNNAVKDKELSAEEIATLRKNRNLGNEQGIVENVLFLSRFRPDISKAEIREVMSKFGQTLDINILGNIAFVDFVNAEDALVAKQNLHHQPGLGAESLIVDFKKAPTNGGSRQVHFYDMNVFGRRRFMCMNESMKLC